jgi:hypothetical protein
MAGRETQVVVEVVVQPDTCKARVTQVVIESLVQPDTGKARVTQTVMEVLRQSYGVGGSQVIVVG